MKQPRAGLLEGTRRWNTVNEGMLDDGRNEAVLVVPCIASLRGVG
jgi:hypothetical protein